MLSILIKSAVNYCKQSSCFWFWTTKR